MLHTVLHGGTGGGLPEVEYTDMQQGDHRICQKLLKTLFFELNLVIKEKKLII